MPLLLGCRGDPASRRCAAIEGVAACSWLQAMGGKVVQPTPEVRAQAARVPGGCDTVARLGRNPMA